MRYLLLLPAFSLLFGVSGMLTGCGKSVPQQEAVTTPDEPEKEKPVSNPAASEPVAEKKESAAEPAKPEAEKPADTPKTIEATVKNSQEYEYRTGFGGDEQGASIKVQAGHFEKSEIIRNPSTGFEPVYKYKPKGDYVGKDSVELEMVDHEIGSGPDDPGKTTKTRVVINFTVVK
jgi:hypothetical protein